MKISIIGAGFTGLSAAYYLSKAGHDVTIFEKESFPGGLAAGFTQPEWDWTLEKSYHHLFTNDKNILNLAKEINFKITTKRPKTSVYAKNEIHQLDSPFSVLKFPLLSVFERLRMGITIAFLKYSPFWKYLEKHNATIILPKLMGKKSYEMIWQPLFMNKFGQFSDNISLAWFWARIRKRTSSLAYPEGGFLKFANKLIKEIKRKEGVFYFNTEIKNLYSKNKIRIKFEESGKLKEIGGFDSAIITIPSSTFLKIAQLPDAYRENLEKLKNIGATNLVLRLKKQFLKDGTYWLNICDKNNPIMAIAEHTNFMDKKNYNNEHLLYVGNYKPIDDRYFTMTKKEILNHFDPYLKKINPDYKKNIIDFEFFKDYFAQPIIPTNYSKIIPPFKTPLKNVYLANMEQVYPWDRGTNYAIETGKRVAKLLLKEK
jgi:protoporphyrinogen oxidase